MNIDFREDTPCALPLRLEAIMSFSKSLKYGVLSNKKPVGIFYLVVVSLYLLFIITSLFAREGANASISGMDMASLVFLFVFGITSFKENFYMLLQNGVSRKNMFLGTVGSILIVSVFVAFVDVVLAMLLNLVPETNFTTSTIFEQLYAAAQYRESSELALYFHNFMWNSMMKFAFGCVGLFIGCGYYKMNGVQKTLVSCGIPVFFFLVLPLIDLIFPRFDVLTKLLDAIMFFFGFTDGTFFGGANSYLCVLCCLGLAAVASAVTFLMLRKTSVK